MQLIILHCDEKTFKWIKGKSINVRTESFHETETWCQIFNNSGPSQTSTAIWHIHERCCRCLRSGFLELIPMAVTLAPCYPRDYWNIGAARYVYGVTELRPNWYIQIACGEWHTNYWDLHLRPLQQFHTDWGHVRCITHHAAVFDGKIIFPTWFSDFSFIHFCPGWFVCKPENVICWPEYMAENFPVFNAVIKEKKFNHSDRQLIFYPNKTCHLFFMALWYPNLPLKNAVVFPSEYKKVHLSPACMTPLTRSLEYFSIASFS